VIYNSDGSSSLSGFDEISDGMKAVSFVWGFSIQTGIASTLFTTISAPHKSLLAHGKVQAACWTTCGLGVFLVAPVINAFAMANVGFMLAYGAAYGYHSFVEPPKES
jgi:hypothetical protein